MMGNIVSGGRVKPEKSIKQNFGQKPYVLYKFD
jgi:hypothetical protein